MTTFDRISIADFELDRPHYAGALVYAWDVDDDGAITTTLATLYSGVTGTEDLANPQRLNSRGRFDNPVYIATPVRLEIQDIGSGNSHTTGIVGANLVGTILEDAQTAANQALSYAEIARRLVAQLGRAIITPFSYGLLALSTASQWQTGLGISNFIKGLLDDSDGATARGTLGAAASATTVTGTKSITGGGDLSAPRVLELDGDEATPGNRKFYKTNAVGAKGWTALAAEDLPDGSILQVQYAEVLTNADLTGTIPIDDTTPQNTEGTEWATITITPKFSTSKILLMLDAWGSTTASLGNPTHAIFVDSQADAIAAKLSSDVRSGGSGQWASALTKRVDAGSTAARTYKARIGFSSGTLRLNGGTAGRFYGGVGVCTFIAIEIKA